MNRNIKSRSGQLRHTTKLAGDALRVTTRTLIRLALAGIFFALAACGSPSANDNVIRDVYGNEATLGANPVPARPTPKTAKATWGQIHTWADGLAVEVSPPAPCKPKYAAEKVERAVKFTIKITNGSGESVSAALLSGGDAQFAGKKAELVVDLDGPCGAGGFESATILPGKTYTYTAAYAVGKAAGEMQLSFKPHLDSDEAVYVGQA